MRGKESDLFGDSDSDEDHPRLCGEKRIDSDRSKENIGITPAYAGKSRSHFYALQKA